MSTLQSETARANGSKSKGPITLEGKAKSSQNAMKHGLAGGPIVLPYESQQEFDALHADFIHHFRPANSVERDLVHEIVSSRWRLRRIERMECALMSQAVERQLEILGEDADIGTAEALAFTELAENSKGLRLVERYSRSLRRSYEKAWQELERLQRERAEQNEPEHDPETDYSSLMGDPLFQDNGFMNAVLPYVHKPNQLVPETRKAA
jgi:hypothetical protein